ncbi:iron ABC transporter permease [Demequina sp. SYSU T00039]|uniref:Iron ABC transporter permease n=1 Tax=Demequina lignilytica TaxID=3051663 RepID=A0AAW7M0V7_9MICO|nr:MULTISPECIES: iron ABC transporter permease [unclassified Demequina]MDN4477626.1 iron ABC transporter permease [Demequina sp. SYSU T00039-1]MDN4488023.1 iron ABC transporter permease [Demequina sp. SYSU T00039]MDN4490463.1 iron ABC transporter permease [Demequina sp. SYSU T00068]
MRTRALVTLAAAAVLLVAVALSLAIGSRSIDLGTVWEAIVRYDPTDPLQQIVRELRASRTVIGLLAGAALGVAGALMQALTRNPFADPGLLGINAGASLAVVLGLSTGLATGFAAQVPLAFIGAGLAAVIVYAIGARGAAAGAPVRLALAGVALTALISSVTYAVLMVDDATLDQFRLWVAGSLTGRQADDVAALVPVVLVAIAAALVASRQLEAVALGEDTARSLGVRIGGVRTVVIVLVTLLAAAATAAAGPIVFVGLAVPHLARALVGASLPWLVIVSALGGAALMLVCDVVGRVIAPPGEIGVGITTAFIGGIIFALMARRMKVVEL